MTDGEAPDATASRDHVDDDVDDDDDDDDDADDDNVDDVDVQDLLITSALEFAVGIAAAGAKLRPQLPFPPALRPFLKFSKLPPKALGEIRRAVSADQSFRRRLATVAGSELVDDAGLLWLQRPAGWRQRLGDLGRSDPGAVADVTALRRSERRREAAEAGAHRAISELAVARAELERRRADGDDRSAVSNRQHEELKALRARLAEHDVERRRLAARLDAATAELEQRTQAAGRAETDLAEASRVRDELLAARAHGEPAAGADACGLLGAAEIGRELATRADHAAALIDDLRTIARRVRALEPGEATRPPVETRARSARHRSSRRPIALPGGLYGSSIEAVEYVVRRPGVRVLVDGYNVAKLAWPQLDLEAQRMCCIDACEDVARRHGTEIVVVFDGSMVAGASSPRRLVRVTFSPEGVSADDVVRSEVAALADTTPVVVVTNDQAIVHDVRGFGANVVSSEQWLAFAGR